MAKPIDIQIDEDMDDIVVDGDFLVEDTTRQNQRLLIVIEKAENKMEPGSCVGIGNWILDEADGEDLKKEIQSEFEGDGMVVGSLVVKSIEDIEVSGTYGN